MMTAGARKAYGTPRNAVRPLRLLAGLVTATADALLSAEAAQNRLTDIF
jgi:hypothetical protein